MINSFLQLIPTKTDDIRQKVYITVSGAAVNSNENDGFFEVNAAQYTSHYKNNRPLSILPVRAYFDLKKYKARKPIPSDNTYVSVEGFLTDIETNTAGHIRFRMSVDNISFLGRTTTTLYPSMAGGLGKHSDSISLSKLAITPSLQDLPLPPSLPV
jgi:hypothetical protein